MASTAQLIATITPSNATNKNVLWSSSNPSVATVNAAGLVEVQRAGSAVITAASHDGKKTAVCPVTVTAPVTGVTLSSATLQLTIGGTQTLTAIVTPASATNRSVTWNSSNPSVATVNNSGVVTAISAGTAVITVKTVDGGFTASCGVTVTVPVTGLTLNKTSMALVEGGADTLIATVTPSNATNKSVTWSSSNLSVATVSNGVVTAKAAGSATITATTVDGGRTASCSVSVASAIISVTGVTVSPKSFSIAVGNNVVLTATVTPSNATNKSVTWSSSNTAVAKVSAGIVTGVSAGSATITATTVDGGKTDTCSISVTLAVVPVTGVTVSPKTVSLTY